MDEREHAYASAEVSIYVDGLVLSWLLMKSKASGGTVSLCITQHCKLIENGIKSESVSPNQRRLFLSKWTTMLSWWVAVEKHHRLHSMDS